MHTLLDLRGNIPSFIHISDGKLHDVNILDQLIPEAGSFYVMDRGYIDFQRLYRLHQAGSFFVTRAKRNMDAQRRYSHPVDRSAGVIFDQTLMLHGYQSAKDYPESFRGIRYKDPETGKRLLFITNNTALPALSICALYKARWQVELFFEYPTLCTPSDVIESQRSTDLRQRLVGQFGGFGWLPLAPRPFCIKSTARWRTPEWLEAA
jgi:IS4 transposase